MPQGFVGPDPRPAMCLATHLGSECNRPQQQLLEAPVLYPVTGLGIMVHSVVVGVVNTYPCCGGPVSGFVSVLVSWEERQGAGPTI